ncbi:MAG: hypothetical protein ACRDZX_16460 [Acidimicrobiales bacterium]
MTAGTAVPWSPTSPDSLVGDSGNPADWPAAQAKPPSLAGAYGTNMIKAIVTLIRYEDWVWSHPNPTLVDNYMVPGGNVYSDELKVVTQLVRKGWHTDPSPSEIDWVGVTVLPAPLRLINGKIAYVNGHIAYKPASVNIVIRQRVDRYLNNQDQTVGHTPGGGKAAFSVTLNQGTDGQWKIVDIERLHVSAGLGGLVG